MLVIAGAVICTIFAGLLGSAILGNLLNWPDAGAICAIATMGAFILDACMPKSQRGRWLSHRKKADPHPPWSTAPAMTTASQSVEPGPTVSPQALHPQHFACAPWHPRPPRGYSQAELPSLSPHAPLPGPEPGQGQQPSYSQASSPAMGLSWPLMDSHRS